VLTLREGFSLRVFENRAQRKIFGPKWGFTSEWRRLRKEKLYGLYFSTDSTGVIK
jgi:hypothetical protein